MRCVYLFCLLPLLGQCFTITKVVIPPAPVVYGGSTKPVENFAPFNFASTSERSLYFRNYINKSTICIIKKKIYKNQ